MNSTKTVGFMGAWGWYIFLGDRKIRKIRLIRGNPWFRQKGFI